MDPHARPRGLLDPNQTYVSNYEPTWRDQLYQLIAGDSRDPAITRAAEGVTGSTGIGPGNMGTGAGAMDALTLPGLIDVGEAASNNDLGGALTGGLLAAAPFAAGKIAAPIASKVDDLAQAGMGLLDNATAPAARSFSEISKAAADQLSGNAATHLSHLKGAGLDKEAFTTALKALRSDRNMSKEDIEQIMYAFSGGGAKTRASRDDGLEALQKKFNERVYRDSKMKIVENTQVW